MCGALAIRRAVGVEQRAGEIQPLLDVHRIGGVLQGRAHLLGDGHEQVVEHLQPHRIGARPRRARRSRQRPRCARESGRAWRVTRAASRARPRWSPVGSMDHGRARRLGFRARAARDRRKAASRQPPPTWMRACDRRRASAGRVHRESRGVQRRGVDQLGLGRLHHHRGVPPGEGEALRRRQSRTPRPARVTSSAGMTSVVSVPASFRWARRSNRRLEPRAPAARPPAPARLRGPRRRAPAPRRRPGSACSTPGARSDRRSARPIP